MTKFLFLNFLCMGSIFCVLIKCFSITLLFSAAALLYYPAVKLEVCVPQQMAALSNIQQILQCILRIYAQRNREVPDVIYTNSFRATAYIQRFLCFDARANL